MSTTISRPEVNEYAPYYQGYVGRVPEGDIREILGRQLEEAAALLGGIDEERGDYAYAQGKWSIKEVVGHIIDAERHFAYRALRFARGDAAPVAGFDQDEYMATAGFSRMRLNALVDEFANLRRANLRMFEGFDEAAWLRRGVANENEVSVRALAYIMAGHAEHHLEILRTRYL